ncbi:TIGR00282 family metallophosphoesterase [Proteinivorax hydrogeniformans]|uniref:TIGR00282 family metallophosphoesterase n=1 Tax=Proteinivorax hydrogeniformans TaxID=1826727 RepID=A0AAU8HX69_9FIRM
MKIIFIGDIVGKPGRKIIKTHLPEIIEKYEPDLIIANGENAAGGKGLSQKASDELFEAGIDILTMGNHVWDKKEILNFIEGDDRIVRPANYPTGTPGKGYTKVTIEGKTLLIVNISGLVYMPPLSCPFKCIDEMLASNDYDYSLLDFHAEATSEKIAMGWYLDGKVNAVVGTHTHVQTADHRALDKGTLYISDVGMTGPYNAILGVKKEDVINKFITKMPTRFNVEPNGPKQLNAVFLDLKAKYISPIQIVD